MRNVCYGNQARSKVKDSRSRRFDLSAQMGNPFPQGFAGSNPARSTIPDKHFYVSAVSCSAKKIYREIEQEQKQEAKSKRDEGVRSPQATVGASLKQTFLLKKE